jgi:hypothetical protein
VSARYGRWDLLDEPRDPVPGDEAVVQRLADVYTATGEAIAESAAKLRRLADLDGWKGKAAEKFGEAAEDVAGDLAAAERRYVDAGAALKRYVAPLSHARQESWSALQDAMSADADMARYAGNSLAGVEEPTPEQLEAQDRRADAHRQAAGRLAAAKTRLGNALTAFHAAAATCATAIENAAKHGKDGFWDNAKGKLRDFADWAHLDVVVKVLTVIAIAIAAVAIVAALFFTAPLWLGPALLIAGAVVGGLSLAANLTMAVSEHEDGSWTNVALDVLGLATLGASRVLTNSAKGLVAGQRATAATAAGTSARTAEAARLAATTQARVQVANALRTAPDNPLHIWALGRQAEMAAEAARAGDTATQAVLAGRLRDTAAELARIRAMPDLSAESLAALARAEAQLTAAGRIDAVGHAGLVVNAVDLPTDVVKRFDDYIARVEWRLSR